MDEVFGNLFRFCASYVLLPSMADGGIISRCAFASRVLWLSGIGSIKLFKR